MSLFYSLNLASTVWNVQPWLLGFLFGTGSFIVPLTLIYVGFVWIEVTRWKSIFAREFGLKIYYRIWFILIPIFLLAILFASLAGNYYATSYTILWRIFWGLWALLFVIMTPLFIYFGITLYKRMHILNPEFDHKKKIREIIFNSFDGVIYAFLAIFYDADFYITDLTNWWYVAFTLSGIQAPLYSIPFVIWTLHQSYYMYKDLYVEPKKSEVLIEVLERNYPEDIKEKN